MGQTQSKQGLKEEDVSELIRCSSDLSISDRSHTSIKDKAKKKKGLDLHQGVFYGGIKKKRFYKASNSETIRNHNQVPSSSGTNSSSSSSIISSKSGSSFFNSAQNEELFICSTSVEDLQEGSKMSRIKPDWNNNSNAWAFLSSLNTSTCSSEFLRHQHETNDRPGYLIGSGKGCNIRYAQ